MLRPTTYEFRKLRNSHWRDWGNWRRSVDFIKAQTGLDLLNNIPLEIQNVLELNADNSPTTITATTPPSPPVPEGDDDEN